MTKKLRTQYRRASKMYRGQTLDRVVATTGMGRSTARRMLTGPRLPAPAEQVDRRRLRPRGFSDDARALLEHVWSLAQHAVRQVPGGDVPVVAAAAGRSR